MRSGRGAARGECSEDVASFGIVGIRGGGFSSFGQRLLRLSVQREPARFCVVSTRVVVVEALCGVKLVESRFVIAIEQCEAEVVVCGCVVGRNLGEPAIRGFGVGGVLESPRGAAPEIVV